MDLESVLSSRVSESRNTCLLDLDDPGEEEVRFGGQ